MKKVITTLGAGALALTLAACSDSAETAGVTDTSEAVETSAAEASPVAEEAAEDAAEAESGTDATDITAGDLSQSVGGSYEATLDGAEFTVSEEMVVCQEVGGQTVLSVGPTDGSPDAQAISIALNADESVASVAMGSTTGRNLAYAPGVDGEATATVEGNTYTITGSGMVTDMNDVMAMPETKPFEVTITCD